MTPQVVSGWYAVGRAADGALHLLDPRHNEPASARRSARDLRAKGYRVAGVACVVAEIEPLEEEKA